MNAVNPIPSPATGAEPSMEEILASIRRIIADDQPAGGASAPEAAVGSSPPGLPAPEAPTPPMASETANAAADPDVPDLPPEHGIVSAPQFVSPDGTAGFIDSPHPLAPQPPAAEPAPDTAHHVALSEPDPDEAALRAMHDEIDVRAAIHELSEDTIYEAITEEPPMRDAAMRESVMRESAVREAAVREPPIAPRENPEDPAAAGLFSAETSQSLAAAFNTLAISRLAADSQELRGLARDMLRPLLKDWLDTHLPGLVESIIREEIDRMARRTR